jgi:hypothetical protein
LSWDGASEIGVGEVEDGEKREVTDVRRDRSNKRQFRQRQSGDALSAPAARDAEPVAEGGTSGPVGGKDAVRVGELGFESQQGGEVGVAAVGWTGRRVGDG